MIVRIARVKVGNRQAPQQQTETPPSQVGFLRFQARKRTGIQICGPGPGTLDSKHWIYTVADFVDARDERLLANGIDV